MMFDQNSLDSLRRQLPFWDKLTPQEVDRVVSHTSLAVYRAGETVNNAANECVGVLVIKRGQLRTYILSEEGKEITLYRLNDGEVCILSASCLLSNITFDVHIDAEQDTEVWLINPGVFSALLATNVYVENFALRLTADRFSDVMWAMEQVLFMSFDRRLAIFLLDEMTARGSDTLAMTHEQIAKYVGSAREVVSRMLKYFSTEGMVELYRGGIRILDKERLKALV
jgi:CRP/FNR family transcriptional regulator